MTLCIEMGIIASSLYQIELSFQTELLQSPSSRDISCLSLHIGNVVNLRPHCTHPNQRDVFRVQSIQDNSRTYTTNEAPTHLANHMASKSCTVAALSPGMTFCALPSRQTRIRPGRHVTHHAEPFPNHSQALARLNKTTYPLAAP